MTSRSSSTRTSLRRAGAATLAALALAAGATGCTSADDQPGNTAKPGQQPSVAAATTSDPDGPTTASAPTSNAATPSATATTTATPTIQQLAWKPLPGDPDDTITTNGTWTLTIAQQGGWWSLGKGTSAKRTSAPKGEQVMHAGLDDAYAVVVYGDQAGRRPQTAVVTDLASGKQRMLDGHSDAPPSSDGSWALDGSTLWHATGAATSASPYCLAATDLGTMTSTPGWCAPKGNGFTNILAAGGQASMMTFDDARPTSCRTLVTASGAQTVPYPDVPACRGSQGAVLGSGSATSRVWSIVPDEHRYQQVRVYASTGDGVVDLGPGVNGTLTVCGSAAYWARDAASGQPAALMRWDGQALSVAYEAKGFLGEPLCAGHVLSIADATDNGARQLSATVS